MHRIKFLKRPLVLALGLGLLSLGVACGGSSSADKTPTASSSSSGGASTPASSSPAAGGSAGQLAITATEYAFTMPDSVPSGLVQIKFTNNGKEDHSAQLLKLNNGVTQAQALAALQDQSNPAAIFDLIVAEGGANITAAGKEQDVVNNLPAGNYLVLSFGGDTVPDFAQGMVKAFTVGSPGIAPVSPPSTTASVTTADYNFLGLDSLKSGQQTIEVKQGGPQTHEVEILKLPAGMTADQFKALVASDQEPPTGTAPPESAGGLGAMAPGATGYLTVNLQPGNYVFACFIPDKGNGGIPHAALGMVHGFTVQ